MRSPLPRPSQPSVARASDPSAFELSASLVERLRARDEAAYAELYRIAFVPLAHFAYGYLRSTEAAEDVVQDVLCRIWALGGAWTPKGPARTYLYSAVRNAAINTLRHARVMAQHEATVRAEVEYDPETAAVAEDADVLMVERLRAEIGRLTERQRTAFELRYTRGLPVREVALVLGVTTKSAEKLFARALGALRAKLRHLGMGG